LLTVWIPNVLQDFAHLLLMMVSAARVPPWLFFTTRASSILSTVPRDRVDLNSYRVNALDAEQLSHCFSDSACMAGLPVHIGPWGMGPSIPPLFAALTPKILRFCYVGDN
jgi:hypothetical protein